MLDNTNSVWLNFFHLPPHTKREKNHQNIALCFAFANGRNQTRAGPPAQQASVLAIAYWLLWTVLFNQESINIVIVIK